MEPPHTHTQPICKNYISGSGCSQFGHFLWKLLMENLLECKSPWLPVNNYNMHTWLKCTEHFGTTSLLWLAIRSNNWLTRNDGGRAATPPLGTVICSRHIGHLKVGDAAAWEAILRRQWRQTVCEHGNSFGVCSLPSYIPG